VAGRTTRRRVICHAASAGLRRPRRRAMHDAADQAHQQVGVDGGVRERLQVIATIQRDHWTWSTRRLPFPHRTDLLERKPWSPTPPWALVAARQAAAPNCEPRLARPPTIDRPTTARCRSAAGPAMRGIPSCGPRSRAPPVVASWSHQRPTAGDHRQRLRLPARVRTVTVTPRNQQTHPPAHRRCSASVGGKRLSS
jgi:hypothetical protein